MIILLLEIQIGACLGNLFFIWVQNKFNLTSKTLLILHLSLDCLIPIWALFGVIPGSPFGLLYVWEFYLMVAVLYSTQLGAMLSASRSLYGHLIPIGHESKFFGLYELTDKGSSWLGPLIASFISNSYSLRWAMIYTLLFFAIAIPIIKFGVNYDEGLIQAGKVKIDSDDKNMDNDNDTTDGRANVAMSELPVPTRSENQGIDQVNDQDLL